MARLVSSVLQGGWPALLGWMVAAAMLSSLLTALTIRYAHRRRMFDLPGQRRSHSQPTARGGGIAIVTTILLCVFAPILLMRDPAVANSGVELQRWLLSSTVALLIVAWVGWLDDRGGLSARIRFIAHCLAALVLLSPAILLLAHGPGMNVGPFLSAGLAIAVGAMVIIFLGIVWSINLHNFMDGINGLLSSQAIFVLSVAGFVAAIHGGIGFASPALIAAAAIAGFLPFNFPSARIFMGDVGSGALGLLIAIAILAMPLSVGVDPTLGLIACSAFATDATATLLSRMLRGRRWYSAHREHLYQWLVRSGYSHAQVVGFYMGWNVIIVVPAIVAIQSSARPTSLNGLSFDGSWLGLAIMLLVYVLALALWVVGKRYSLARVRAGSSHGIA